MSIRLFLIKTLVSLALILQSIYCSSENLTGDELKKLLTEVDMLREFRYRDHVIIKTLEERLRQLEISTTPSLTTGSNLRSESSTPTILEGSSKSFVNPLEDRTNGKHRLHHRVRSGHGCESVGNFKKQRRAFRKLEHQLRRLQLDLAAVKSVRKRGVGVGEEAEGLRLETELLRTEIHRFQQDLESLRADREKDHAALAPLRVSQATNIWLQETVEQLRTEMSEMAKSFNVSVSLNRWQTHESNMALLRSDYDALQKEIETLQTLLEKNSASVDQLQTEMKDLRSHSQRLFVGYQHLSENVNSFKNEVGIRATSRRRASRKSAYQKNAKEKPLALRSLLRDYDSGDEGYDVTGYHKFRNVHRLRHHRRMKMEVTTMQRAMKAMVNKHAKIQREILWLKKNFTILNSTVQAFSQNIDRKESQITEQKKQQFPLVQQNIKYKEENESINQEFQETKTGFRTVTHIITAVDKLHSSIFRLFETLEVLEDRFDKSIQDLQKEVSKSGLDIAQIQSSFKVLREDQRDHHETLKTLKKNYSFLKTQNEVINQSLQECRTNNIDILQGVEIENLEYRVEEPEAQITNYQLKPDTLYNQVQAKICKSFLTAWVGQHKGLKHRIRNISTTLLQMRSDYSDLKSDISKLVGLLPKDCSMKEITMLPAQYKSGVYLIHPQGAESVFSVYCDMNTAGGYWTVIQRRVDGSQDFYRSWKDYKRGFGEQAGEYWLGNEVIHQITTSENCTLRVDMWDTFGSYRYAEYDLFHVANETDNYRLLIGGYHGNATDAMGNHNTMAFSTKDRDNDASSTHCAVYYSSGWWYNNCQYVNINGRFDIGLTWYDTDQHEWVQLTKVEMKLRHF
ncbi:protein scabrous-like [Limulus polyphemus]|uniref:Protein scabrous-like n=1 Tax=Limulus polyphemus TaxID=6850 RepID=A0ABM1BXZ3_LIMPO|nr:protein scabrous-like [Limulus polyphemus]